MESTLTNFLPLCTLVLLAGVSNLQPNGSMQLRIVMSRAQHKIEKFLRTLQKFFLLAWLRDLEPYREVGNAD